MEAGSDLCGRPYKPPAVGRKSPYSVYDYKLATYGTEDGFDHRAAEGFIKLVGLELQAYGKVHAR